MPIGNEEEALKFVLELNPVFQHTVVVAEVKLAGRTHAGQNSLLGIDGTQSTNSFFLFIERLNEREVTGLVIRLTEHYSLNTPLR
jgi:hypothetical protein